MHSLRTRAAGVAVSAFAAAALLVPAPAFAATDTSQTFSPTGAVQTWTVPSGVTEIYVDLAGAQGGSSYGGGGGGAELTGTLSVTPGETLNIIAGSTGGSGQVYFTGAGGGGGSFIYTTADQAGILAAAGGGGGAASNTPASPASTSTAGTNGGSGGGAGGFDGNGGGAGTASSPYGQPSPAGGGGGFLSSGGGNGGQSVASGGTGGGGGGGTPAGGGGGGYSGGGGGSFSINGGNGGGGGGGSYFSGALTGAVADHGGNGFVTIFYPAHLTQLSADRGLPGDALTIRGSGLADATVSIGGVAATVTSSSDTKLVVTVPVQPLKSSGALTVVVTTAGGVKLPMVGAFSYLPAPSVTSVAPSSIPQGSAPTVTVTGARFTGASAVYFGTRLATSFTVVSDTSITATVPADLPAGTVNTTVVGPSGVSDATTWDELTVVAYPVMTLSPGTVANGQVGVAYAARISAGGGTSPYTYSIVSGALPGGIALAAASGDLTGTPTVEGLFAFAVQATDQYGNTTRANYSVDVRVAAPTISAVSPASGPIGGDTDVTITGTNFTGATAVSIGGAPVASFRLVSATTISAVTAPGAAGERTVTVTTPGGTSAVSADVHFTYAAVPTVTAVGPTSGTTLGGTSVTITGTGFTGATAVDFGRVAARSYTVDSDTSITAVTPASIAGTVDVRVATAGGVSTTRAADRFTFDALAIAPVPTALPPAPQAPIVPATPSSTLAKTGAGTDVLFPAAGGLVLAGLTLAGLGLLTRRRREAL